MFLRVNILLFVVNLCRSNTFYLVKRLISSIFSNSLPLISSSCLPIWVCVFCFVFFFPTFFFFHLFFLLMETFLYPHICCLARAWYRFFTLCTCSPVKCGRLQSSSAPKCEAKQLCLITCTRKVFGASVSALICLEFCISCVQIKWQAMSEVFDIWASYLEPVQEALH